MEFLYRDENERNKVVRLGYSWGYREPNDEYTILCIRSFFSGSFARR